jgi:hypothetical protein
MAVTLVGVRLLLASVFALAGVAKLRDRPLFARALQAFSVPDRLVGALSVAVPALELATALLLIPAGSARVAGVAACVLLVVFTLAVGLTVRRGGTPECSCFGSATAEPVGVLTIARNLVLLAMALSIAATAPVGLASVPAAWASAPPEVRQVSVVAWTLLLLLAALSVHAGRLGAAAAALTSRVDALEGQLRLAASAMEHHSEGPAPGSPAPGFDLPRLEGDRISLDALRQRGLPVLLIFSDVHCPACTELWSDIGRWQRAHAGTWTIAVICSGPSPLVEMKVFGRGVTNVLVSEQEKVNEAYRLPRTPAAVIVDRDGRIQTAVTGAPAIRRVVAERVQV